MVHTQEIRGLLNQGHQGTQTRRTRCGCSRRVYPHGVPSAFTLFDSDGSNPHRLRWKAPASSEGESSHHYRCLLQRGCSDSLWSQARSPGEDSPNERINTASASLKTVLRARGLGIEGHFSPLSCRNLFLGLLFSLKTQSGLWPRDAEPRK